MIGAPEDIIVQARARDPGGPAVPDSAYDRAWMQLRIGRTIAIVAALTWLPMAAIADATFGIQAGMTIWASCFVVGAFLAGSVRCPRCKNRFTSRGLWHNSFATRCLHCGQRQWSDGPSA